MSVWFHKIRLGSLVFALVSLQGTLTVSAQEDQKRSDEQTVSFLVDDQEVVGTLTIPRHISRPPVVLILPGTSGDRDGSRIHGDGRGLFTRTAQLWAEAGMASLRISPRGRGGSDGDFSNTSFDSRIAEAEAAIGWLSARTDLDRDSLAVLGHSQGTIIAARLARRFEDRIKSVVLWAPIVDPLASYTSSMGSATLAKGLHAERGEIVRWRGVGGTIRAFKSDFFKGLLTADPLDDISHFHGRLLTVTGRRDRWALTASAKILADHHPGEHSFAEFDVGHRMGAKQGLATVDEVAQHTVDWLLAAEGNR
ncbi:alpha/beta fold hydrolase [Breoghania sp. L-A4]|uniref:alpha/beta hydrolase family protein n=1 Tax=Breoghania sp. L-A4 TaxID=2304600 RepID=UPI0013C2C5C7|nr:alpha/beta fold hydrolase [Breoghania sp. L-A4]